MDQYLLHIWLLIITQPRHVASMWIVDILSGHVTGMLGEERIMKVIKNKLTIIRTYSAS